MAVRKDKSRHTGKITWSYCFDAPGSSRQDRKQITAYGFESKKAAKEAESNRQVAVQAEYEAKLREAAGPPKSLAMLLNEFCKEHAERNLAPKTIERYHDMIAYLSPTLLATPVAEITSVVLTREWNRLRECGGHHRRTKAPRPLSSKTVRNIAGVVSSAFARGMKWGIAASNPVSNSDLPPNTRKEDIAFSIDEQNLLLQASHAHWALPMILEISAATGARRGEVLALRWADVANGKVSLLRSLSQTKAGLFFKTTKNRKGRTVSLPASTIPLLQRHRAHQEVFRRQFGPDYKSNLDLVFADPDGSPLRPDSISAAASALCRRLKLPKGTSLHSLRHSHGSHLLAAGMELPAVSARLGHSNPYVTATVYAHVLLGRDDEAAKIWDEFQQRKTGKTTPPGEEPKMV